MKISFFCYLTKKKPLVEIYKTTRRGLRHQFYILFSLYFKTSVFLIKEKVSSSDFNEYNSAATVVGSASKLVDQVCFWDKNGCNRVFPQTFGDGVEMLEKGTVLRIK